MADKKEISSRGIAQRSGLDVFSSMTTYNGEYLNWGNALAYKTQLTSDADYIVDDSTSDPAVDALTEAPQTTAGRWFRYHTNTGTNYYGTTAPTSSGGYFTFNGDYSGGLYSHSGIYQRVSLVTGVEYQIDISLAIGGVEGILYVETYFPRYNTSLGKTSYKLNTSANIASPIISTSDSILSSTFTAQSQNDVIVIYFTDTAASATINVTNISIKEKQEYLVPTYVTDKYGNAHKTLRRSINTTLSND